MGIDASVIYDCVAFVAQIEIEINLATCGPHGNPFILSCG